MTLLGYRSNIEVELTAGTNLRVPQPTLYQQMSSYKELKTMDYDKTYNEPDDPIIGFDPENGEYIVKWVNGIPRRVYL